MGIWTVELYVPLNNTILGLGGKEYHWVPCENKYLLCESKFSPVSCGLCTDSEEKFGIGMISVLGNIPL